MFHKQFAGILSTILMLCIIQFAGAIFIATAAEAAPFISIVRGDSQFIGTRPDQHPIALPEHLVVVVTNRRGNPLAGVNVRFSVYSVPEGSSGYGFGTIVDQVGRFRPDPEPELPKNRSSSTDGTAEIGFRIGNLDGVYKIKAEITSHNKHVIFNAATIGVYDDIDYIEVGDPDPIGNINRNLSINDLRIVNLNDLSAGASEIVIKWNTPTKSHIVVENSKTWFVYYLYEIYITPLQIRVNKGNPMDYEPRCYWEPQVYRGLDLGIPNEFTYHLERDLEYRESDVGTGDSFNVRDLQPGPSGKPIVFIPSGIQDPNTTTFKVPHGVYEFSVRYYEFRNDHFAYPAAYIGLQEHLHETGTRLRGYHAFGPAATINANGLGTAALSVIPDGLGGTKWVVPFQVPIPDNSGGTEWVENTIVPESSKLPVPTNLRGTYVLDDYGFATEVTLMWDPIVNNPPVTQYGAQYFDTTDKSHPDFPQGFSGGFRTIGTNSIEWPRFRVPEWRLRDFVFHAYAGYNNIWSESSTGYRFSERQRIRRSSQQPQQAPSQPQRQAPAQEQAPAQQQSQQQAPAQQVVQVTADQQTDPGNQDAQVAAQDDQAQQLGNRPSVDLGILKNCFYKDGSWQKERAMETGVCDSYTDNDFLLMACSWTDTPDHPQNRSMLHLQSNMKRDGTFCDNAGGAPSLFTDTSTRHRLLEMITTEDVSERLLDVLQARYIVAAPPKRTALLPNYPNPFNPETWIPYELATDTDVRITIYNTAGQVVRKMHIGYQDAGYYLSRDRAAYWDGRNESGEHVSSGIYVYMLSTDKHSVLRKMVIRK